MSPPIPKHRSSRSQWVRWTGTAISLLLFFWLLARQDWSEVWRYLSHVSAWLLALIWGLYFMGMALNALRWYILLQAPKIRLSLLETGKIVFMGAFISNFLPSTVGGDAARALCLFRSNADRAASLASILLDRIVNVCAFMTILPFSVITFSPHAFLQLEFTSHQVHFPLLALGSTGIGNGRRWLARVRHWVVRGRETIQVWLNHPFMLVAAFVTSWFSIFVIFVANWLLAQALGIQVTLYQVMGVTGITYLLTLLPISVNGLGVGEIATTNLYGHLGASLEQATTLAILSRFFAMTVTLPGAFWVSKVASGADQAQETQPNEW